MVNLAYGNAEREVERASGWLGAVVRRTLTNLFPFAVLILVWGVLVEIASLPSTLLPGPIDVYNEFLYVVRAGILPDYIGVSLGRWLAGAFVGLAAGVVVALIFANSATSRSIGMPIVRFFTATAELSFLPLLILWFGVGTAALICLIAYSVAFPVVNNTLRAIEAIPATTFAAVRTLGGGPWQVVRHVMIPGSTTGVMVGFRIGAGYAFRALIAAEIFASSSGLGFMVFQSRETLNTPRMLVGMTVMGCLWLFIDRFYLRPIEAATVLRWGTERET